MFLVPYEYELILGNDMTKEGELGLRTKRLLDEAAFERGSTGRRLVVAAGYNPDLPRLRQTLAELMAEYLYEVGVPRTEVVVLSSRRFNTIGELLTFEEYLNERYQELAARGRSGKLHPVRIRVRAFSWHIPRVWFLVHRHIGGRFAKSLKYAKVRDPIPLFALAMEPLKFINAALPLTWQDRLVRFYKRRVSQRTSY